ncbi:MAG: hypothetical protein ACRYGA_02380 [Janthinobacterium lividum]
MDTTLQLGGFVFEGLEVPEVLVLGGAQTLVKHNFPGGARILQALGADHAPISWRGLFLGGPALQRAKALDFMRVQGAAVPLTVFDSAYTVVIARFEYGVENFHKIGYSITVEVVEDRTRPVEQVPLSGFETGIQQDMGSMLGLGRVIGDGPLSGALSTLDTTIRSVSSFASASTAVIQSVLRPIADVSNRVSLLTASVRNTIGSVTTLGGVLPNNPLAASIGKMAAQVTAAAQYPVLLNIQSLATRVQRNVSMANQQTSLRTMQVAGGTLYKVAADEYGDATRWPAIAQASGLKDVILAGVNKLTIPARPVDSGGVPTL